MNDFHGSGVNARSSAFQQSKKLWSFKGSDSCHLRHWAAVWGRDTVRHDRDTVQRNHGHRNREMPMAKFLKVRGTGQIPSQEQFFW
jgi:hypothetical protein